jgi:DUF4097 and DUF4098 domain-containing protein YvlB
MNRQKSVYCFIILLVVMTVCTSIAYAEERQEIRRSFTLNRGATVSLGNISGDIKITSGTGSQVELYAVKTGPAEQMSLVDVTMDAQPSRLSIQTVYPKTSGNNRVSVSYDLKVPRDVNLDSINSVSGDIEISDINGRVVGHTVSGDIRGSRISQDANLESVSGDVHISDAGGRTTVHSVSGDAIAENIKGDLETKSVSGDVQIRQVQGYVQAESVSGDVSISNSTPTGLTASAVSGDLKFDGRLNPNGRYSLKSHSGSVTMDLPSDSGFALRASTFSGSVNSDFDIKVNGSIEKKTISGVVGSGGPTIELNSFSGSVLVRKSSAR